MDFYGGGIVLDSNTDVFFPGQTLHGQLRFRQSKVKTIRGIYAEFKGFAHVQWRKYKYGPFLKGAITGRTGNVQSVRYTANEEYFCIKQYLVGGPTGEYQLQEGEYDFPFECLIPLNCPSSYRGRYGFIKYRVKIVVDIPWKFDITRQRIFKVKAPLDLKQDPNCFKPIELSLEATYCSWCRSAGFCEAVVKLPQTGFYVGQTVPVEVAYTNNSRVKIDEISLEIVKETTFYAHSPPGSKTVEESIFETSQESIASGTNDRCVMELDIPDMDPCNLTGCRIIDISYYVKVKLKPSGCHMNSDESQRIAIGDVLLNDSSHLNVR